ncbi:Gibberellin-regulated protein 14 [Sesamum alatum]|uniref:Gibberellin-regulated protein 14 n=1 Tax=Sesamum alatum TaxID=300844 RepID=A0AAE1YBY4_9LAMI|nr:Gibberellin-regulated protein 14 [Sesamum alatum]
MDAKLILALIFSLFFISQVSSDFKNNEETSHVSQLLHGFGRGGDRKLMRNLDVDLSTYFKDRLISRALALTPAPAPAPAPSQNPNHLDCGGLCKHRCSLHSRQNLCMRACGTCCVRCKCVPPGTYGNRDICGECYTNMTTHGNKPKCP